MVFRSRCRWGHSIHSGQKLTALCYDGSPREAASFHRPAMVVAHPGHELTVYGWAKKFQPRIYILTDGSGSQGVPRTVSSERVLAQIGSERGEIFGMMSDAEFYSALREGDITVFAQVLGELVKSFIANDIDCVIADAAEGFNPAHDLCRALVNMAATMVERSGGRPLPNFAFKLSDLGEDGELDHDTRCTHFHLSDSLFREKVACALKYKELSGEVVQAMQRHGIDRFRMECLRRVEGTATEPASQKRPYYEIVGEQRVTQGIYRSAIRYLDHIAPIIEAMKNYAAHGVVPSADRSQ